jgi:hypothetical protein
MPEHLDSLPYQIDHIIARKHRGMSTQDNLALACFYCNTHKGPNIAGINRSTGEVVRLFHPRRDAWPDHFYWEGARLRGLTDIGRVTIDVLCINDPEYVAVRQALIDEGVFPPDESIGRLR